MPVLSTIAGSKTLFPPLGLLTVASLLPSDFDVRLVDLNVRPPREADWDWADVVMLSGMLVQREGLHELLREAKRRNKTTVVGGPYASSCPEDVSSAGCDFLMVGEVETTMGRLVDALREGRKAGAFPCKEKPDVSQSPIPRFDLIDFRDYAAMGIQTSRGCPFDCEFCDVVNLYGRKIRYKTPDRIVEELETLYRLGWRHEVFLCDDNFIGSRKHARAILEALIPWMKRHGEPFSFFTQVSVNLGQDRELIDLMTEANFATVFIGLETPDEEALTRAGKLHNIRNPMLECLNTITGNGLSVIGSFVLGLDGETKGAGRRITDFVEESGLAMVMINLLQAFPATRLWERLKREGRLLEEIPDGNVTSSRQNYIPTRPTSEVVEEYGSAWERLYDRSRFLERAYRQLLFMRPTRRAIGLQNETPDSNATVPRSRSPLRRRLYSLAGFFRILWWQGVKPKSRAQFWQQFIGILRKNPSRYIRYLDACAFGESLIRMAPQIRGKVGGRQSLKETAHRGART